MPHPSHRVPPTDDVCNPLLAWYSILTFKNRSQAANVQPHRSNKQKQTDLSSLDICHKVISISVAHLLAVTTNKVMHSAGPDARRFCTALKSFKEIYICKKKCTTKKTQLFNGWTHQMEAKIAGSISSVHLLKKRKRKKKPIVNI